MKFAGSLHVIKPYRSNKYILSSYSKALDILYLFVNKLYFLGWQIYPWKVWQDMRRKHIFWSGSMDIFFDAPDSRYICTFSITKFGSIPWVIDNERLKIIFFLNRAELTSWAFNLTINSSASGRKIHKLWPAGPFKFPCLYRLNNPVAKRI